MLIVHHDRRRSDLLQSYFRHPAFGRRENIVAASSATSADNLLRNRQGIRIWRWSNQGHCFVSSLLYDLMADEYATEQKPDDSQVHHCRNGNSIRSIIVVPPPDLIRPLRNSGAG